MKRVLIILSIISTLTFSVDAGKIVFYIHGTFAETASKDHSDDDTHKLGIYKRVFTPTNGTLCWYDSRNKLHDIGTHCYNTYVKTHETNNDVILVGHSMGGSVVRTMLDKSSNIKGIITAGTANYGSVFFNKLSSGDVWFFLQDMYNKASNAITVSKVNIANALLPGSSFAASLTQRVCKYNSDKDKTLNFLKTGFNHVAVPVFNYIYPCLNEMAQNSNFNNELNAKKISVPYINIYGAEDAWEFVRLLSTQAQLKDVNSINNIDKTYDEDGVKLLNGGLSVVNFIQDAHDVLYDVMSVVSIVVWKYKSTKELVRQARYNWDGLYKYIQTDMHNEISKYNGSYQYESRTYRYTILGRTYTMTSYVPVVRENDGMNCDKTVMLPESMAGTGGVIYNVRATGVNHMEMGNHKKMREIFEQAFKTNTYGAVFKLQQTQ